MSRLFLLLALLSFSTSCLRGGQERANLDKGVGQISTETFSLSVEGGLAAIWEANPGYLELWLGAPIQHLTLELKESEPLTWQVTLHNTVDNLEVSCDDPVTCDATLLAGDIPTQKTVHLSFSAPGTHNITLAPPDSEEMAPFSFILFSDVQEELPNVQDAYTLMNTFPEAKFVISAGDLTEQGTKESLIRYQKEMRALNIPQYVTSGNHDIMDGTFTDWSALFGRHSSSFTYRGTRFTFADSSNATLDPIVYGWLKNWLIEGKDQLHIFTTHIPIIDPNGFRNGSFRSRQEAHKLLAMLAEGNVDITLYGHIHTYLHFENAGIEAIISGGGGAWPERLDGIGRHFILFTVDPLTQEIHHEVIRL